MKWIKILASLTLPTVASTVSCVQESTKFSHYVTQFGNNDNQVLSGVKISGSKITIDFNKADLQIRDVIFKVLNFFNNHKNQKVLLEFSNSEFKKINDKVISYIVPPQGLKSLEEFKNEMKKLENN